MGATRLLAVDEGENADWLRVAHFVDGPRDLVSYRGWLRKEHGGMTPEDLRALPYRSAIVERRPELVWL